MLTDPDTLRIAVLCGRKSPGLGYLLGGERTGDYLVAGIVASDDDFVERPFAEDFGVPIITRPLREFHRAREKPVNDLAVRAEYDLGTVAALRSFRPDLVLLSGWLYVLTAPLLIAFRDRILSVHHSDLTANDPLRRYPGLHAVRDALVGGENETRSTLHLVDGSLDLGAPILRSWPIPIEPAIRSARADGAIPHHLVRAHERRQIEDTFGPLMVAAASLAASGRLSLAATGPMIDGIRAPFDLAEDGTLIAPPERFFAQEAVS